MGLAMGLVLSSCHTGRKVQTPLTERAEHTIHVEKTTKARKKIVDEAMTWVGTPYRYGGVDKGKGVDCSGMVMEVYLKATGIKIPRNSAKQAEFCHKLREREVVVGDLIFFATGKDPDRVSHVGIVVDDTHFIHASSSKGVVVSELASPYFQRTFKMFGRVPEPSLDVADNEK